MGRAHRAAPCSQQPESRQSMMESSTRAPAQRGAGKRGGSRADALRGQALLDWSRAHLSSWALREPPLNHLLDPNRKRQATLRKVPVQQRGRAMLGTLQAWANLTGAPQSVVASPPPSRCAAHEPGGDRRAGGRDGSLDLAARCAANSTWAGETVLSISRHGALPTAHCHSSALQ